MAYILFRFIEKSVHPTAREMIKKKTSILYTDHDIYEWTLVTLQVCLFVYFKYEPKHQLAILTMQLHRPSQATCNGI